MKYITKRLIGLLLVFVMMLGLTPFSSQSVYAATTTYDLITSVFTQQPGHNNGSISPSQQGLAENSSVTVTFTPDKGYEIYAVEVNDSLVPKTDITNNSLTLIMNENKKVVVSFVEAAPSEYTITFNPTGGSVDTASAMTNADGVLSKLPAPTREGYTFKGWYTQASGGSQVLVTNVYKTNTTIYAQWLDNGTTPFVAFKYTVKVIDDGHGTAAASVGSAEAGTRVILIATPNSGYKFKEWQVVKGGVNINQNQFIIDYSNVEIKAIFEEEMPTSLKPSVTPHELSSNSKESNEAKVLTFMVRYDLNGGSLNGEEGAVTLTVEKGATITLPMPTREGYTFEYWDNATYDAQSKYVVEDDHTFIAQWKENNLSSEDLDTLNTQDTNHLDHEDVNNLDTDQTNPSNTQDENNISLWIGGAVVALIGVTIATIYLRKKKISQ